MVNQILIERNKGKFQPFNAIKAIPTSLKHVTRTRICYDDGHIDRKLFMGFSGCYGNRWGWVI